MCGLCVVWCHLGKVQAVSPRRDMSAEAPSHSDMFDVLTCHLSPNSMLPGFFKDSIHLVFLSPPLPTFLYTYHLDFLTPRRA